MQQRKEFYGEFGGQFAPETLIPALDELEAAFNASLTDESFKIELDEILRLYAGRPTPVYFAKNISEQYGFNLYLKREDLLHTGAHKINNTLGQALLSRRMKKGRVIAETGAGQHGVASATAAALFGLECTVYMGRVDAERQEPNLKKMRLLGAHVEIVDEGLKTLKDAVRATMREWVASVTTTHYIIGSAVGPHPFPKMVAHFQSVIGDESLEYFNTRGFMPDAVIACVGGGSNAIGIFRAFLDNKDVRLIGVEAGGRSASPGDNAATLTLGKPGIFQGCLSYLLQDTDGLVEDVHSVSAGLDYPGVGPEHAYLHASGRVDYVSADDRQALRAFRELTRREGIIPALESSHALAYLLENADSFRGKNILLNLSGRGDKDFNIIERFNLEEL